MNEVFNSWEVYLVLFIVFVVIYNQGYKSIARRSVKDGALTIILQIVAGLSVLVLIPLRPLAFPAELGVYLLLLVAILFYALNDRLQTTTRKHLEVSEVSIIGQLSSVFLIAYGITIFHEELVWERIAGAIMILLGNVLILYKKGKFDLSKFSLLAVFGTLVFATAISIDVGISEQFNLAIYTSITLIVPAVLIVLVERISLRDLKVEFEAVNKRMLVLTGVFWSLAIYSALSAYQIGDVTIVAPLASINVLLNVIVAFFVHKERSQLRKKILAAVLVLIGVYLTVLQT